MPDTNTSFDGRHASPDAQKELRRCCILLFKQDVKRAEIARRLGLSRQWVTKIIQVYLTAGEEAAIAGQKRGMKEETAQARRSLTKAEEALVRRWIVDKNPRQLKFDFDLWTSSAVQKLIHRDLGRELAIRTVRKYLSLWGMTSQSPKKKAIEQDGEAGKQWLEKDYPVIADRARKEKATIFWEAETAAQQDANWGRGCAPCGEAPAIMISAVNNQGLSYFCFQKKAVTRYAFIRFLHRLIKENAAAGRKLFVICGSVKFRHAELVQAWCEKHQSEIELFFPDAADSEVL